MYTDVTHKRYCSRQARPTFCPLNYVMQGTIYFIKCTNRSYPVTLNVDLYSCNSTSRKERLPQMQV